MVSRSLSLLGMKRRCLGVEVFDFGFRIGIARGMRISGPSARINLPVLMKHLVHSLCGTKDPTLKVIVNNQITTMLLDTGAHV